MKSKFHYSTVDIAHGAGDGIRTHEGLTHRITHPARKILSLTRKNIASRAFDLALPPPQSEENQAK